LNSQIQGKLSAGQAALAAAAPLAVPPCPKCGCELVPARARGQREMATFVLGGEIHRCVRCLARFGQIGRLTLSSGASKRGDAFAGVFAAIFCGFATCLAIAFWMLHRFHRWPF
jgi:hypothetical protein